MNRNRFMSAAVLLVLCAAVLMAGGAADSAAPSAPAAETTKAEPAAPTLIIGALFGGPITDAGYNQAMHEAVSAIGKSIAGVKIIVAENVPDEAGATSTMENMISQGAKLIFATAFNHQYPALELSRKYPNVIFEHAGGWEMSSNFANFFGEPPEGWYLMGVAAGKMTETNKLGFVAAFPLGWSLTFINAFHLGAQSVNPDVQTIVAYTFNWGDRAKEADTTNSLINQGADVITMHVDSPATVLSTAESRGAYSIGYQNIAAQQFAPQYWISGTGFTLGGTLTRIAQQVIDGTWKPQFLRGGIADGFMTIAPFGPNVPKDVVNLVKDTQTKIESGNIVVFAGPVVDQKGNVMVPAGGVLGDNQMASVNWFARGVVGSPK